MSEQNEVDTRMSVSGDAAGQAGAIGTAFEKLGSVITSTVSLLAGPLMGAFDKLKEQLSLENITELGSKFEQTQIQMAGFFKAMGMSKDIDAGMGLASQAIEKIRIDSAALPGEAEEYFNVFKANIPVLTKAVGGGLDNMLNYSDKFTAIAKTFGLNMDMVARDMTGLLREGHATANASNTTWLAMLPTINTVAKYAKLTAEEFNKMSAPERAKAISAAFEALDPMLKKSAGSFDAMKGALKSNVESIIRLGTTPLFEMAKKSLERMNGLLYDSDGNATALANTIIDVGRNIGSALIGAFERAKDVGQVLWDTFERFRNSDTFRALEKLFETGKGVMAHLGQGVQRLTGQDNNVEAEKPTNTDALIGVVTTVLGVLSGIGPMAMIVVGAFASLADHGAVLDQIFAGLIGVYDSLLQIAHPVIDLFMTIASLLGDGLAVILPPLINLIQTVIDALRPMVEHVVKVATVIANKLRPVLQSMWEVIAKLINSISGFLGPTLTALGETVSKLADWLGVVLLPALTLVASAVMAFGTALGAVINFISDLVGAGPKLGDTEAGVRDGSTAPGNQPVMVNDQWSSRYQPPVRQGTTKMGMPQPLPAPGGGAAGGGGRAVQDFRFSRFQIDQKFAEGMDADRIATAMVQDIGRVGEQRLQSGFEPLFSLR